MKKTVILMIVGFLVLFGSPAARAENGGVENVSAKHVYTLHAVHPVNGRQGICAEDGFYWVSGSTTLTKYDKVGLLSRRIRTRSRVTNWK